MAGFLPGGIGYGRPAGIPDNGSMGGVLAPQQQGGGLFGSYAPQAGGIFAALMDAGSRLEGRGSTDNFANYQATNQQNQMRQQLLQGLTSGDPEAQKQAVLAYTAAGGDPSAIMSAMSFGKPKVEHYGEADNVFEVDPFTGARTQIQTAKHQPKYQSVGGGLYQIPEDGGVPKQVVAPLPKLPEGMATGPTGKLQWQPGYLEAQGALSGVRRAPPKANANGAISLPHPGSMW